MDQETRYHQATKDQPKRRDQRAKYLEEADLAAAKALAATKPSRAIDTPDKGEVGLLLRVRGANVSWILRRRSQSRLIASGFHMGVKVARERARTVRDLLDAGVDPGPYLAQRAIGKTEEQSKAAARAQTQGSDEVWTWATLAQEYTKNVSAGRVLKNRRKAPSRLSVLDVERAFDHPEIARLKDKRLTEITRGDVEGIGLDIRKRSQWAHSKFIIYTKAAFNWADHHRGGISGAARCEPWWTRLAQPPIDTPPTDEAAPHARGCRTGAGRRRSASKFTRPKDPRPHFRTQPLCALVGGADRATPLRGVGRPPRPRLARRAKRGLGPH